MKSRLRNIVVATDFSPRSDRALRRGGLLAKQFSAKLLLVHVVDDDQPARLLDTERNTASTLLAEMADTLRSADRIECDARVVLGDAFAGILETAESAEADIVVIGPHRRQILRDIFVGTTAERTIRAGRCPALMANGVPAGPYRRIVVAVDMSDGSAAAVRVVREFGLNDGAEVEVLHVYDSPDPRSMQRAMLTQGEKVLSAFEDKGRAAGELMDFLARCGFKPVRAAVHENRSTVADEILRFADETSADLIVVGTQGRTGIGRMLLGSVAQQVLGLSGRDVLAVPSKRGP